MKFTINKLLCTPFPDASTKTEVVGNGSWKAMRISTTKTDLVALTLLANCHVMRGSDCIYIPSGTQCWIRKSEYAQAWGSEVFALEDGQKAIIVPFERFEFFDSP